MVCRCWRRRRRRWTRCRGRRRCCPWRRGRDASRRPAAAVRASRRFRGPRWGGRAGRAGPLPSPPPHANPSARGSRPIVACCAASAARDASLGLVCVRLCQGIVQVASDRPGGAGSSRTPHRPAGATSRTPHRRSASGDATRNLATGAWHGRDATFCSSLGRGSERPTGKRPRHRSGLLLPGRRVPYHQRRRPVGGLG